MERKTKEVSFHHANEFNKDMTDILSTLLSEKLKSFFDFCIQTNNAEPIKTLITLINENQFNG